MVLSEQPKSNHLNKLFSDGSQLHGKKAGDCRFIQGSNFIVIITIVIIIIYSVRTNFS